MPLFVPSTSDVTAYLAPIDNSLATSDITLGVGQTAFLDVVGVSSIPLFIATAADQTYELTMVGDFTATAATYDTSLHPNGFPIGSSSAVLRHVTGQNSATSAGHAAGSNLLYLASGACNPFIVVARISTSSILKQVLSQYTSTTLAYGQIGLIASEWRDLTAWTSLGTVNLSSSWDGRATIRRLS